MAGWTLNKLARRQQAVRPAAEGSRDAEKADDPGRSDAPSLTRLLARKSAELLGRAQQLSLDDEALRPAAPRLVSSNTGQDMELSRIVELEIIPRLMLMHSAQPAPDRPASPGMLLTTEHVQTLARLAVEGDAESASAYVRALLGAGATQEQVFLDLLAPCARWLGHLWDDDRYDFSQVTVALWRLQRVLHEQGSRFNLVARPDADSHRALLAAVPGAQHTFGVIMAAEFFSRAGWDVECEPKATWSNLQARVKSEWFDMFGLSIATGDSLSQIASAILDIRKVSANPRVFVMVGGPMAAELPDLALLCGADAVACEAVKAVEAARHGVGQRLQAG